MKRRNFLTTGAVLVGAASSLTQALGKAPSLKKPFVVEAGQSRFGDAIRFLGLHPNDLKISGKDTNGALSVFEYTGLAKVGPMLHIHFHQDEIFMVTQGEYRFVVGNEIHDVKAGGSIFLPRNISHTWIQLTERGSMIYMLQPAGKMEEFFITMNELKVPPSKQIMDKIHKEHGMAVVGPPINLLD